jgi:hypothetical protein
VFLTISLENNLPASIIDYSSPFSKSLFNQKDIKLGDKYYFHWTDLGMFYTGIKSGMGTVASLYNIALKNELKNEQMVNVFKGALKYFKIYI